MYCQYKINLYNMTTSWENVFVNLLLSLILKQTRQAVITLTICMHMQVTLILFTLSLLCQLICEYRTHYAISIYNIYNGIYNTYIVNVDNPVLLYLESFVIEYSHK